MTEEEKKLLIDFLMYLRYQNVKLYIDPLDDGKWRELRLTSEELVHTYVTRQENHFEAWKDKQS